MKASPEAYQLMHEGAIALAQVSANGMRVDEHFLNTRIKKVGNRIRRTEEELKESDLFHEWVRIYGEKTNLGSREQLAHLLFNVMGFESRAKTAKFKHKTDVDALAHINHPFVKLYGELEKQRKLHGTYLLGLKKEVVDGYVHPMFNLHIPRSMRSSSDRPNFQNIPIRDGDIAEIIRSCFIPRPGHRIIENDFKGIEVGCSACYNQDPVLIEYIKNPKKDMHRDNAMKLFLIDDPKKVHKDVRYAAKNGFTFPGFYGSYFLQIAPNLWQMMEELHLTVEGVPMREHLKRKGIYELGECDDPRKPSRDGTYEKLVREYEDWYWNTQYSWYTQWKKDWWEEYLRNGYFRSKIGFHWEGVFDRNQVLNYPIQGTAFHWLLWVLIRLQKWLTKNKMRSRIVGQIHDSILGDVHDSEMGDYLGKVKELVEQRLAMYWDWIIVPLTVEAEVTPIDGSWHTKKEIKL